jgi:hypothetical protein
MARSGKGERGAASVEHAALVLLMALVACAIVGLFAIGSDDGSPSLASAIARKQRCAVRYPAPCWQDPLTEAYGRDLAGAIRALAPAPVARPATDGTPIVGVDYRRCRQVSCAIPGPDAAHLTLSGRRTTAFTAIHDRGGGEVAVDYWIYRPTIGWERVARHVDAEEVASLARTPLLETADPALVPLETLLGRDDARFPPAEEPPWRGQVESRWGR